LTAVLGVWINNPVTAPFNCGLEYESGRRLLDMEFMAIPNELTF